MDVSDILESIKHHFKVGCYNLTASQHMAHVQSLSCSDCAAMAKLYVSYSEQATALVTIGRST